MLEAEADVRRCQDDKIWPRDIYHAMSYFALLFGIVSAILHLCHMLYFA